MDITRAKELLTLLADGIHPISGEVLSQEDSVNHPEIVRALHAVLSQLEKCEKQSTRPLPQNAGKPWSKEEEDLLCSLYDRGTSKSDLCRQFRRTIGAINARLNRNGRI